jgi:hypothetical protein
MHFSPNSVAGCISKVECSVGGNLEWRQTLNVHFKKAKQLTVSNAFPV